MWRSRSIDPAARLSRYWDARGTGRQAAAHQAGLDPSLLGAIDLLHTVDDAHDPAPAVLDRMERTLMKTIALSPSRYDTLAVPAAGRNGRVIPLAPLTAPAPLRRAGARRHGLFGAVATAAIVVLVVIASLVILHPDRRGPLAPAPALIQAIDATSAPLDETDVATHPLLSVTIPEMSGDAAYVAIERFTLPAATALHADLRGGHAPGVFFVEEGTLSVRSFDGPNPVRVIRGAAATAEEPLTAGTSAELATGDAIVVPELGNADLQNLSTQPARILYLLEPDNLLPPEGDPGVSCETLIGGVHTLTAPLTLSLQRVTLAPEASLPGIDAKDVVQLSTPVDPERVMDARKGSNGSLRNAGDAPLDAYVLTVAPYLAAASPGDEVTTETRLDTTIAAIPVGRANLEVDFWRISPEARPLPVPALGGTQIVLVESGEVAVNTAEPLVAGEQDVVTGGETAFLTAPAGDASLFTVHLSPGSLEPAKEVQLGVAGTSFDYLIYVTADGLPGGSGRLVLERITVPPGGTMPPQEAVRWSWTEVGSGELGLTLDGERFPFRWKFGTERTFRFSQKLPLLQPGTRMTFRNAGDDPLVLYRLTLAPMEEAATPAT